MVSICIFSFYLLPFDVEVLTRTGHICTTLAYQIYQLFCANPSTKQVTKVLRVLLHTEQVFTVEVIVQFSCEKMDGMMGIYFDHKKCPFL